MYKFNSEYSKLASQFPATDLQDAKPSPVVLITNAVPQQVTRETYANVLKARGGTGNFQRATVYGPDGISSISAEHYRKTDLFNAKFVYNNVSALAKLTKQVEASALATWGVEIEAISPWWVAGYGVGDKFDSHCDGAIRLTDGSYKAVENRVVSALLYINTKDDSLLGWGYSGGALSFPGITDDYGVPLTINPKEGDLVIFPSNWNYCHGVSEVTAGYRVCLTNFFRLKAG
jgi:predicted 2-oxoglutarate/Fe(II)-dependent dioxygenase YbiX